MFHVGQHVVCVDADGAPMLSKGSVYTVVGHEPLDEYEWRGISRIVAPVVLAEAKPSKPHRGFSPERFRPLSSTRLDVFRRLLVSPKERVGA